MLARSGSGYLELCACHLLDELRQAGSPPVVLGILVISAVGGVIGEVRDDHQVPVAFSQSGIEPDRVAQRSGTRQILQTVLNLGEFAGVVIGPQLGENDTSDHLGTLTVHLDAPRKKYLTDSKIGRRTFEVTSDYADALRVAELRVTRPRVAVLQAVEGHPHADTDTIFGAVRAVLPEVSRQAVYDVLAALTAVGLVRKIQPSGSVARYESRVGDNHHHLVCRSCGTIADVDCAVGEAPCLTPADPTGDLDGFVVDEAEVVYWGLCPDCSLTETSRSHQ